MNSVLSVHVIGCSPKIYDITMIYLKKQTPSQFTGTNLFGQRISHGWFAGKPNNKSHKNLRDSAQNDQLNSKKRGFDPDKRTLVHQSLSDVLVCFSTSCNSNTCLVEAMGRATNKHEHTVAGLLSSQQSQVSTASRTHCS